MKKELRSLLLILFCLVTGVSFTNAQSLNCLWARTGDRLNSGNYHQGTDVAVDGNGNVYCVGFFLDNSISFGTDTLNTPATASVFLVKYGPNGNVIWAKAVGGKNVEYGYGVAVDGQGDVYITGDFLSPKLYFDPDSIIYLVHDSNGGVENIFLAKYDSNGNLLWVKNPGGSRARQLPLIIATAFI